MPILIVDDYRTMLRIVRSVLNQLGFRNVDEATDAETACEMIAVRDYGLVLSDWNMQPMSGLDLLKKIRSEPKTAQIPFIMVTAEAHADNVAAAGEAGVNGYIVKPFTQVMLGQKLTAVLGAL
jgi:two-component system chemotaxis response regulator CheY